MSDVPGRWTAPGNAVAAVNPDDLRNGMGNGPWRSGATRRSAAALDRHRTPGSREEVPTHQRLSRNPVAEGTPESVAHSAEGGPDSRSCLNLVVRKVYCAEHREPLQSTKTRTSSGQFYAAL